MKLSQLTAKAKKAKDTGSEQDYHGVKFMLIYSGLLKEYIVLITKKKYFKESKAFHSDKVRYFIGEVMGFIDAPESEVKKLHQIKKEFGGWITAERKEV